MAGLHTPSPKASHDEALISQFTQLIEDTPAEDWKRRSEGLQYLVAQIPKGERYYDEAAWYNSPASLRGLSLAVSELLKDARSTVVKRTCEQMTILFRRCKTNGRYLLRDIMPTILSVHAQTAQIVRLAVQNMVVETIPEVPCKMVMPLWMERLKIDKSRTVREACALYLGKSLQAWTEPGYLTEDIWMQVGVTLLKTLRDPSPAVRSYIKAALETMRALQSTYYDNLINDPEGPAAKDMKLRKWLKNQGTHLDVAEDLSVASRFTYNSDSRFAARSTGPPSFRSASPRREFPKRSETSTDDESDAVPKSIHVSPPSSSSKLGPPMRLTSGSIEEKKVTASRPPALQIRGLDTNIHGSVPNNSESEKYSASPHFPANLLSGAFDKPIIKPEEVTKKGNEDVSPVNPAGPEENTTPHETSSKEKNPSEGPFIVSMQKLKDHALKRRSRNSLLMQERFRLSNRPISQPTDKGKKVEPSPEKKGSVVVEKHSEEENVVPNKESDISGPTRRAPEHMVIAVRLLRAHKMHVDRIMETLKMEMDALRDFDRLLEEVGRPTEEETLDYFESVGLCLDQRSQASAHLQHELDRISRGEPPVEEIVE